MVIKETKYVQELLYVNVDFLSKEVLIEKTIFVMQENKLQLCGSNEKDSLKLLY